MADTPKPEAGGPNEQPDLDLLLNELGAVSKETGKHGKPPTRSAAKQQTEAANAPTQATPAPAPAKAAGAPKPSGAKKDSIDDLLAGIGKKGKGGASNPTPGPSPAAQEPSAPATPAKPPTAVQSPQTDINLNPRSVAEAPAVEPLTRRQGLPQSTQSAELDRVLEKMQAAPNSTRPGPQPVAQLGLSQTDLDSLVAKHSNAPDSSETSELMISQNDINNLVNQLTELDEASDQRQVITDILSKHTKTIDQLMKRGEAAKGSSVDALAAKVLSEASEGQVSAFQGATRQSASTATMQLGPLMAPADLRGTRYLLAAAVLLLALCAGTLTMMIKAITGLSQELRQDKQADKKPEVTDNYGVDLNAALSLLDSDDAAKVAIGIEQFKLLKKNYSSHELDLSLMLAKHYRKHGDHHDAALAYGGIIDRVDQLDDDPTIYLDYADSLKQAHDGAQAIRIVYVLLAKESQYLSQQDGQGRVRSQDQVAKNAAAIQRAYLTLGRLLAEERQQEKVAPAIQADNHQEGAHGAHGEPHS